MRLGTKIAYIWSIGMIVAQIAKIENDVHKCSGETVHFNWTYTAGAAIFAVVWHVNVSNNIAFQDVDGSQPITPSTGYATRLTQFSDVGISLSSLSESDSGVYSCEVTDVNGISHPCTNITLSVYDSWSEILGISKTGDGDSILLQSSINDDRTSYSWIYKDKEVGSGFKYKATENGNYTLTLGKRGLCLNGSSSESIIVTEILGLTTLSSTINSDMSTTVSEPFTMSSNISTTVTEVSPPQVNTSSTGLSQEILITIISSSILAIGVLILLIVLVVNLCRQRNRQTPAKKPKENRFATKQGNFTKKDGLKSSTEPRTKLSGKRNTKQESISLDKFEHTQFNNSQALKDRMYEHNTQTTDYTYLNNIQNQHVFNHSYAGRNMISYGNQHDSYPKSHSRPNHNQLYQSCYPEHPGQNEGMFQYYRADNLYQRQQMYQRPCVALYDLHIIDDKQDNDRSSKGRAYEKNWDLLY